MDLIVSPSRPFPGTSLAGLWSATKSNSAREPILSELSPGRFRDGPSNYPASRGGLKSLITDEWHFIFSESGDAELYAWREDPKETRNLAGASRPVVEELKQRLNSMR
jgi:hypothetical protein